MQKYVKVVFIVSLLLAAFSGTASALTETSKDVRLTIENELEPQNLKTRAETVGEFLAEEGIVVNEKDMMNVTLDTVLGTSNTVYIIRGFDVSVTVDGNPVEATASQNMKTGNLIAELESKLDVSLYYDGSYGAPMEPGMTMALVTKTEKTVVETEEIPFETVEIENDELEEGLVEIAVAGEPGEFATTVQIIYQGGKEFSRAVISEEVVKEPVDEVIHIGTKILYPEYDDILHDASVLEGRPVLARHTVAASAYTSETVVYTATGRQAQRGVIAVDPDVIPLGTLMYIEGYGIAVAGDTGGSIDGLKVDLFFDTYEECIQFGRKNIDILILGNE